MANSTVITKAYPAKTSQILGQSLIIIAEEKLPIGSILMLFFCNKLRKSKLSTVVSK